MLMLVTLPTALQLISGLSRPLIASRASGPRAGFDVDQLQPKLGTQCMRTAGMLPLDVVEHLLPPALQTHELLFESEANGRGGTVLLSQMEEGRLLKLAVDAESGELSTLVQSATFAPEGTVTGERGGLPFVGLHGLAPSSRPGKVWATLQYLNSICLVDVQSLAVEVVIRCPDALEDGRGPIGGPHTVREQGGQLFVCLKGGLSCHEEPGAAARSMSGRLGTEPRAEEATTHALWRVALDDALRPRDAGTLFEAPATPVMCVVTEDGACWVACDASPTLFKVPADATSVLDCVYHQLPYQYALLRQTGPGIVLGPDGRPWFCILNGNGVLGRVTCCGKLQMFELLKTFNPSQRLCHISFDAEGVLYAISSDLLDKQALNTLIRVKFDASFEHIVAQHEIAFPSQQTAVHRILHLDGGAHPSVLVSELSKSRVLQLFKNGLPPLEHFPTKTFEVTTRRVFDAAEPCPRSGNPLCHCAGQSGATIPPENIWADPRADDVYNETLTPSIRDLAPVTDPRTGEEELLHDFSRGTRADSAFSQFWSYGIKGFRREETPAATMYSANGAPASAADMQPAVLGASVEVLQYKPEYLKALLAREPFRRAQLLDELRAAGLLNELAQEWVPACEPGAFDEAEAEEQLSALIASAPVVMFTFGTCPYCEKARQALQHRGVAFEEVTLDAVDNGAALRARLLARTGRSSTPSIWLGGMCIGGLNDGPGLLPLASEGALDPMLRAVGVMDDP